MLYLFNHIFYISYYQLLALVKILSPVSPLLPLPSPLPQPPPLPLHSLLSPSYFKVEFWSFRIWEVFSWSVWLYPLLKCWQDWPALALNEILPLVLNCVSWSYFLKYILNFMVTSSCILFLFFYHSTELRGSSINIHQLFTIQSISKSIVSLEYGYCGIFWLAFGIYQLSIIKLISIRENLKQEALTHFLVNSNWNRFKWFKNWLRNYEKLKT